MKMVDEREYNTDNAEQVEPNQQEGEVVEQDTTQQPKSDQEMFAEKMEEILSMTPAGEEEVAKDSDITPEGAKVSPEEGQTQEAETSSALKDIDADVLQICRDYGWDDDEIARQIKINPDLPYQLRELLDAEQQGGPTIPSAEADKKAVDEQKAQEFEELKFNLDPDKVDPDVKMAIEKIAAQLSEQRKMLTEEQKRLQSERELAYITRVDSCFDRFSKELPDLGNSANLNNRQIALRQELWAHADLTSRLRNIPIEKAIEIEVRKHKNQEGEKAAEQRLLDKLNKQRSRYTHRPTRRHSDLSSRKFATPEEEAEAIMTEAYRQAGIEE